MAVSGHRRTASHGLPMQCTRADACLSAPQSPLGLDKLPLPVSTGPAARKRKDSNALGLESLDSRVTKRLLFVINR